MMFWAKSKQGFPGEYLPLEVHLADVAATAVELWRKVLTEEQRAWFSRSARLDEAQAEALIGFLAGAHDVGKANPLFQAMVPDLAQLAVPDALKSELDVLRGLRVRHDAVSGAALAAWLTQRGLGDEVAEALVATISGHHGTPRTSFDVANAEMVVRQSASGFGDEQLAILDRVGERHGFPSTTTFNQMSFAAVLWLAGLVTVADWIGSDQDKFPVTSGAREPSDLLAESAVASSIGGPPSIRSREFPEIFGFAPNTTQRDVAAVAEQHQDSPMLMILESCTGTGKTEAALDTAARLMTSGARGLYVALPTRATANQMYDRIDRFVAEITDGSVPATRLLHGDAHQKPSTVNPTLRDMEISEDEPVDGPALEAHDWFEDSRRGLISPFAVGTIDQILPAVMNAKHYPVRMWALSGKVIVLDEVHAYDAYTSELLVQLVEWLGALGSSVVILSATLPKNARLQLAESFCVGAGWDLDEALESQAADYPRLTVMASSAQVCTSLSLAVLERKFTLESWHSAEEHEVLAERLVDAVAGGGCVGVVCNTVSLAQQRYRALREAVSDDVEVVLLHSRMRKRERRVVEGRLLAALAKESVRRPRKMIVISTQVIEQSLDIDFDAMFSDLAPFDLLVQRAGRLHRHSRQRPAHLAERRLVILDTPGDDYTRDFADATEWVYHPHILSRTRQLLAQHEAIDELVDVDDAIEFVYESNDVLVESTEAQLAWSKDAEQKFQEQKAGYARSADAWTLPGSVDDHEPWESDPNGYSRRVNALFDHRRGPTTRSGQGQRFDLVVVLPGDLTSEQLMSPTKADLESIDELKVPVSGGLARRISASDNEEAAAPESWGEIRQLRDCMILDQRRITTFKQLWYDQDLGLVEDLNKD